MGTIKAQEKEQNNDMLEVVPFKEQTKGTNFSDRLKELIGNKSGRAFAKQVGISYSTLHNYLTGSSYPTLDNLIALSEATSVDIKWLATGEVSKEYRVKTTIEDIGVTMIDGYCSVNVSAGFGSFNEGITKPDCEEPYSDNLLAQLNVTPKQCAVFWANGDSMLPTISSGDQLLVDLSKKDVKGNNRIYLVQNGDSVWVKRVRIGWEGVELISDNKSEYRPIKITADEAQNLQIIGQVVHIGHSLV